MKEITAIELAGELFKIHTHAAGVSDKNRFDIVYREKDIIELLKKLGYPEPDFEGYDIQCQKELLSPPGATIWETLRAKKIKISEFRLMLANNPNSPHRALWDMKIRVNQLLCGELPIDEAIAEDLERVLDVPKHFWLEREKLYREKLEGLK